MTVNKKVLSEAAHFIGTETPVIIGGVEYTLAKWSMEIDRWIEVSFGQRLEQFFGELNTERLFRLTYKLLVEDDKRKFGSKTVEVMNDDGVLVKVTKKGWERMLDQVVDRSELEGIMNAILTSFGASRPVQLASTDTKKKDQTPTG